MLGRKWKQPFQLLGLHNAIHFKYSGKEQEKKEQGAKKLTQQHIKQASNIKQLMLGVDINRLSEQPTFRQFMRKITKIMNQQTFQDQQSVHCLQNLLFEIRRFSSAQIHSNASDLLNYQLFFKQLKQMFPKQYKPKGFEIRATMVAESMPKIASYEGCEPVAQALLHYMSCISQLSNYNLKRNLQIYFVDYFLSHKISQKVQNKKFKNGIQEGQLIYKQNSQVNFDPNVCAILLSSMGLRTTKTFIQSIIDNLSIMNLNKRITDVKSFLNIQPALKIYLEKYKKSQQFLLTAQDKKAIREKLILQFFGNSQISQILYDTQGNQILVIGFYQKFLQSVDIFLRILQTDYKNSYHNEIDYRASEQLSRFMYMVFLVSDDMAIWVAHQNSQNQQQYLLNCKQTNQKSVDQVQVQQIRLWKVAAQIVESFCKNKIYNANKNKLLELIMWKVVQHLKNKIHLKQKVQVQVQVQVQIQKANKEQHKNNKTTINKGLIEQIHTYGNSIINLVAYMPIQTLKAQCQKQPNTHRYLLQLIKICVKKLSNKVEVRNNLIKNLLNLAKLKNTLIIDRKQWVKIFSTIVKQDKNYESWQLYYFLASTNDEIFIRLIPFAQIIKHLSEIRAHLNKTNNYIAPTQINESLQIENKQEQRENNILASQRSRKWQLQILHLQALTLLVNYESSLPQLLSKNCSQYTIKMEEIESIFQTWIEPFKFRLLLDRKKLNQQQVAKQQQFKFQNQAYRDKPIPYFEKYFYAIFLDSGAFYQFKLINKILTHPTVQNYLLFWQNYSKFNFMSYFSLLLFGLGDDNHKQLYLQKYPFHKIYPSDFSALSIFHFFLQKLTPKFYNQQQWSYFLQLLARNKQTLQGKQLYSVLLEHQEVYKNASFRLRSSSSKQKESKSESHLQNEVNEFATNALLNGELKYQQLGEGYLHEQAAFAKINKKILSAIIQNLQNTTLLSSTLPHRLIFFINYLHQLAFKNSRSYQCNLQQFLSPNQVKQIDDIVHQCKFNDDKQSAILAHKMNQLGLLSYRATLHICKTVNFKAWPSLLQIICLSVIGKESSIKHSLITGQAWKMLEGNIINVSSQIGFSFIWIYYSLKFSSPSRFLGNINLLKRIYNPLDRKAYIKQLKSMKEKLNISPYTNSLDEIELLYKYQYQAASKQNQINQIQEVPQELKKIYNLKNQGYFKIAKNYQKNNKIKQSQKLGQQSNIFDLESDAQYLDINENKEQNNKKKDNIKNQKASEQGKKSKVGLFKKVKSKQTQK